MKRVGIATAAMVAAVVLLLLATLPPAPAAFPLDRADPDLLRRTIRGAYHIHTTRSDGAEDKDAVAAAAARAGLAFAIFTDHGDATRPPDPPQYLHGVLCLDGVEISTNGGHYVALDLPVAPYPLGGEASAVVEDVTRLGGFGIVAHPLHPKAGLSWTDWDLPVDGIEWLNADVEWRNESPLHLSRVLFDYFLRPAAAVASVLDRPTATMARWDELSSARPVTGLAGADAHGSRMGGLEEGKRTFAPGPGYEASFRALTNRLILAEALTGDAIPDARRVMEAIRSGRTYAVVDGVADGVLLKRGPEGFAVAAAVPPGGEVRSLRSGGRTRLEIDLPAAPGHPPIPWVVSNWTGATPAPVEPDRPLPGDAPIRLGSEWRVEKDPVSSGVLSLLGGDITMQYRLAPGPQASQFVGAAADLAPQDPFTRLTFRARAGQPMRLSVQLRFPPDDDRWVKSVYLDATERDITIAVDELRAADHSIRPLPPGLPRSILFVADLVNARPGSQGTFSIQSLRIGR